MENIVSLLGVVSSPWQSVLECVRKECNDFGMAIFDAVGYEGFFDGYACLTVPDKFRETWLNSHYPTCSPAGRSSVSNLFRK